MKKIIKKLNLVFAIMILLSTIFPTAFELTKVLATEYEITWNGKVTYRTIYSAEILQ